MNQMTPPPKLEIIPASAPFSEAQRSWLNGFFAGLLSDAPATPLSAEQGAADHGEMATTAAPWHDQTMPIADRMKLAEGKPVRRKMMAAMAQQDCGQCGVQLQRLFRRDRQQGGSAAESLRARRQGDRADAEVAAMKSSTRHRLGAAPAAATMLPLQSRPKSLRRIRRRSAARATIPRPAMFLGRRLLNGKGSEKETWHIDFDLSGCGLDYVVGDSFGIFASNDLGTSSTRSSLCSARRTTTEVRGKTLREVLHIRRLAGPRHRTSLFELMSYLTGGAQRAKATRTGDRAKTPMAMPRRST